MEAIAQILVNAIFGLLIFLGVFVAISPVISGISLIEAMLEKKRNEIVINLGLIDADFPLLSRFPLLLLWPVTILVLRQLYVRRMKIIERDVPRAVMTFSNVLSAGLSVQEAIAILADEVGGPLGSEFMRAKEMIISGLSVDEAVEKMKQRIDAESFDLFASSILTLRKLGGNLIETLNLLTKTIELGAKVRTNMRIATAEVKSQAKILCVIPWMLMLVLYVADKDFVAPLFNTRLGVLIVVAIVVLEVAGAVWLKKISEIK